jgi:hypothetical protein
MLPAIKPLYPRQREAFQEVVDALKFIERRLGGRGGVSAYDRPALQPGFGELQQHIDRALVWAEEMAWIIEEQRP